MNDSHHDFDSPETSPAEVLLATETRQPGDGPHEHRRRNSVKGKRRGQSESHNGGRADRGTFPPLHADGDGELGHGGHQQPLKGSEQEVLVQPAVKKSKVERRREYWREAFINLLFILSWYLFATLISLYNKWMFSPEHYNFRYPLFVTTFHMAIQFICAGSVLSLSSALRPKVRPTPHAYLTKASPCAVATGLDIGLSNNSLKLVTLSFYTMCKSSSLAFVLIFAFLFKLEQPTWRLCTIIFIITSGVILMVSSETKFSLFGMFEVLTASCLGGLRWSLTQLLLDKQSMGMDNPVATIFWLAPVMGLTLATCSMIFEGWGNVLSQDEFFGDLNKSMTTMFYIFLPGILAFLMTVSEFALIKRTSVVTLSIAGIFKEVGTISLSALIFHDVMTPLNISGLIITIMGISFYNVLKYNQSVGSSKSSRNKGQTSRPHSSDQQVTSTLTDSNFRDDEDTYFLADGSSYSRRRELPGEDSDSDSEEDANNNTLLSHHGDQSVSQSSQLLNQLNSDHQRRQPILTEISHHVLESDEEEDVEWNSNRVDQKNGVDQSDPLTK